ncbi:hypothetical protein [Pseudoleptotrichia goodfellowii]|nr:hypothetical protein [Pseudoleptotrichia goodfellowii]
MFITSFFPLWISIIIIEIWSIYEKEEKFEKYNIEIILLIILSLLVFSSFIYMFLLLRNIRRGKKGKEEGKIIEAKNSNKLTSEFLLAYILPMISFDFTELKGIVIFLIYFITLSFLCIKNKNFYTNIILEIIGYSIYECKIEKDEKNKEVLVLSRNNLTQSLPKLIDYFDFENTVLIEI